MRALLLAVLLGLLALPAAAGYPAPADHDAIIKDFRFHTGDTMPALHMHYTTIGDPGNIPVLILHGTGQSGRAMLAPSFAEALFGPGQPLDATKYFIILPDSLGTGASVRPSDGARAKFPRYNYDDAVLAQYRLLTEAMNIRHVRLILGNSMGGMHVWLWGEAYPGFTDGLVPMAAQPTEMSARNWMTRRVLIESIRQDPAYNGGDYTTQPGSLRLANVFMGIATSGGTLGYAAQAPTREKADNLVDDRLAAKPPEDANDFIYQWESSRDYNPAPKLEAITAPLLAINAADDERNPPETGLMVDAMKRVKNGHLLLIPASAETRGHGTTMIARFWTQRFAEFMTTLPPWK